MGSNFFHTKPKGMMAPNLNMEARSFSAPAYSGRQAGGTAAKDLAAAMAYKQNKLGPLAKTSAVAAPGPKKV